LGDFHFSNFTFFVERHAENGKDRSRGVLDGQRDGSVPGDTVANRLSTVRVLVDETAVGDNFSDLESSAGHAFAAGNPTDHFHDRKWNIQGRCKGEAVALAQMNGSSNTANVLEIDGEPLLHWKR
jgi:hypothetical protein